MEAATPLRKPSVRTLGDRIAIEALFVDDDCAVRLVREREEAGDDPAATVVDAIEIGARVLDREQAAANAEFVKAELERVAKDVEHGFDERARGVADLLERKVDELFGPENGQLAKELQKLFSDGSSASVQNRIRELVGEVMVASRQDLLRHFSSADGSNPLAEFKAGITRTVEQAVQRQHATEQVLLQQLGEVEKQVEALRVEKQQLEQLEAERERGTAKGRSFEELVVEALDEIASAQGDDVEAVGDLKGASGKTGDAVAAIGAAQGPAQGRIVVEAKDRRLSRREALEELDRAKAERDADFALLVVPSEEEIPSKLQEVRRVKSQLSGVKTGVDKAYALIEQVADRVRGQLDAIEQLVADGESE